MAYSITTSAGPATIEDKTHPIIALTPNLFIPIRANQLTTGDELLYERNVAYRNYSQTNLDEKSNPKTLLYTTLNGVNIPTLRILVADYLAKNQVYSQREKETARSNREFSNKQIDEAERFFKKAKPALTRSQVAKILSLNPGEPSTWPTQALTQYGLDSVVDLVKDYRTALNQVKSDENAKQAQFEQTHESIADYVRVLCTIQRDRTQQSKGLEGRILTLETNPFPDEVKLNLANIFEIEQDKYMLMNSCAMLTFYYLAKGRNMGEYNARKLAVETIEKLFQPGQSQSNTSAIIEKANLGGIFDFYKQMNINFEVLVNALSSIVQILPPELIELTQKRRELEVDRIVVNFKKNDSKTTDRQKRDMEKDLSLRENQAKFIETKLCGEYEISPLPTKILKVDFKFRLELKGIEIPVELLHSNKFITPGEFNSMVAKYNFGGLVDLCSNMF